MAWNITINICLVTKTFTTQVLLDSITKVYVKSNCNWIECIFEALELHYFIDILKNAKNYFGNTFQVIFISQRHKKTLVVELFEKHDD